MANTDWFTAANWSPSQVPTSADDTIIDAAVTVVVAGPSTATFNSLTLGDASGSAASTIKVSGHLFSAGLLTINANAAFEQNTNALLTLGQVVVAAGGRITHTANTTLRSNVVNLSVTGDFSLQAGGSITVSGLGYVGGTGWQQDGKGPGAGKGLGGDGGSGAGHGGVGGISGSLAGGVGNDNLLNPTDLGSGGGGAYQTAVGGTGGGAVLLNVAGALSLDGAILANGLNGTNGTDRGAGGGAGGTVNLTAGTIAGAGSISANGGAGGTGNSPGGGGGGGGRVAIVAITADNSNLSVQSISGNGNGLSETNGGAGTIARKAGTSAYTFVIGDLTAVPQSATPFTGSSLSLAALTLNNSIITFDAGSTVTINPLVAFGTATINGSFVTFTGSAPLNVQPGASLQVNASRTTFPAGSTLEVRGLLAFAVGANSGGALNVRSGGAFKQLNVLPLAFDSVLVEAGGVLTHGTNAASRAAILNLSVTGDFDLQAGANVALDGAGYAGGVGWQKDGKGLGAGKGVGGDGGSGGGHGGVGGISGSLPGGVGYDSVVSPTDLGSGGGGAYQTAVGGAGGGALVLNVSGTLSINGSISANGLNGTNGTDRGAGGGAGGTVNLTAVTLAGSGSIQANGGAGGTGNIPGGGGGGGGRVAIVVSGTDNSGLSLQANAGNGNGLSVTNGGAGVIARKNGALYNLASGDLTKLPQSATPVPGASLSFATVTLYNSNMTFDSGSAVALNSLFVVGAATVTKGNVAFGSGAEILSGGQLMLNADSTAGGALVIEGGGIFRQMSAVQYGFSSALVQPGGVMTHAANTTARARVLNLNVSGDFNIQPGATLTAHGLGYAGGAGWKVSGSGPGGAPGSGSDGGAGGGHGGTGGASAAQAGGGIYDSTTAPANLGSGGGGAFPSQSGAAGGGAILLTVGGNLFLGGQIDVAGSSGTTNGGYGSGGGAGGTVNITASTFTGTGFILAGGGAGGNGTTVAGGGGGGGISAVAGCNGNQLNIAVSGGGAALPTGIGGAGAINRVVPLSCPSPPSAPNGLAVASQGEDAAGNMTMTVTWAPVATATSYALELATDVVFSSGLISTSTAVSSVVLRNVLPNSTYYLHVRATNGFGDSAFSGTISTMTPVDRTAPAMPTLLNIVNQPGGVIAFSWQASTFGETSASFSLYRSSTGIISLIGHPAPILNTAATSFSFVPPDNQYYFYGVTALDRSGNESPLSNQLSVSAAITDNADYLIVPTGFEYRLTGTHSYGVSIDIQGRVTVKTVTLDAFGNPVFGPGYLELSAPNVHIGNSAVINANGIGYGYGLLKNLPGTGLGGSTSPGIFDSTGGGGGASHGGIGGNGGLLNGTPDPNGILYLPPTYDSLANPTDFGSKGGQGNTSGTAAGGSGGGRLKISAGALQLDGLLSADGDDGISVQGSPNTAGGGGAGGSIVISATQLSGAGTVTANGGKSLSSDRLGGGGGGGRIAVTFTSSTFTGAIKTIGGSGFQPGAAGTVLYGSDLHIANDVHGSVTAIPRATPISSGAYIFGSVYIGTSADVELVLPVSINAANVYVAGPDTFNFTGSLSVSQLLELQSRGSLDFSGSALAAGTVEIDSSAVLSLNSSAQVGQMLVHAGGIVNHRQTNVNFNLTVSGALSVESGGRITADGKGYPATQGPGAGYTGFPNQFSDAGGGGGGGYGGLGGRSDVFNQLSGAVYGALLQPNDLGSGGGNSGPVLGGTGGGLLRIDAGTLQLDGLISADGSDGANGLLGNSFQQVGGGGAGGTVVVTATNFHGTGVISANGGASPALGRRGGGGAGGRIVVSAGASDFAGVVQAHGGPGVQTGGAGTVVYGNDLRIGNTIAGASTTIPSGNFTFMNVQIASGAVVEMIPNATLNASNLYVVASTFNLYAGAVNVPHLELQPASFLRYSGGVLTTSDLAIDSGANFSLNTAFQVPQITIHSGGTVTHDRGSFAFDLNVPGVLNVESGGRINADGQGFDKASGPGAGYSTNAGMFDSTGGGGGAGYGGLGGRSDTLHPVSGAVYGSITQPEELGSGGGAGNGNAGGRGGGRLKIEAGTLQVDGQISANGTNGVDSGSGSNPIIAGGGGSGGAVLINAANLQGSGSITANGGSSISAGRAGGGGGGGRIALYYNAKSGPWSAAANGGSGRFQGSVGTILDNAHLTGFDATAATATVSASQMSQKLNSTQSLSETIGAQSLDFTGAITTGTAPGTFSAAQMSVVLVKTGSFSNDGFFRGTWTLGLSAVTSLTGEWEGMAYLAPDSPRRLILKGVLKGQIRGTLDGTLTESATGSGIFDRLSAACRAVEIDAAVGAGDIFISGAGSLKSNSDYPGTTLSLLQTSLTGQTAGYYTNPLDVTFTFLHVNSPGNPFQGEGFFVTSYVSPLGPGSGWAYGVANDQAARLAGIMDVPLRGLMEGALTLSNPHSLLLTLQNLDLGLPFNPALTVSVTGPDYMFFGATVTYSITVRNDGYASADGVTVVALTPNYTSFVSASGKFIRYNVTNYSGPVYIPRPHLRWDFQSIPARGSVTMFYQSFMLFPGIGQPALGTSLASDVQLVTTDYADKIYAYYPSEGTQ